MTDKMQNNWIGVAKTVGWLCLLVYTAGSGFVNGQVFRPLHQQAARQNSQTQESQRFQPGKKSALKFRPAEQQRKKKTASSDDPSFQDSTRLFSVRGQDVYGSPLPPTQAIPNQQINTGGIPQQQNQAIGGGLGQPFNDVYAPGQNRAATGGGLDYFNTTPSILGRNSNFADLDVFVPEGPTGKFLFGGAYNSDAGVTGQIVIDERNFDIRRWPRNFGEVLDGKAFRGRGQRFRLELMPGSQVQRYMASLSDPYLWGTNINFSTSGYFYKRRYFDWDEERLGARVSLGYRLTPFLSLNVALRAENVELSNPRLNTSPTLNNSLGDTDLFLGTVSLTHDTRDHPFLPSDGRFLELKFSQGFGEVDYSRGELDWRRYFLLRERADHTGRHTLAIGTKIGISGSQTPIFENYFAGGFSTLRGFDFRGASPVENGVTVGGRFQWLNTVEYTFPLSGDDMIKGVAFVDFGTVEDDVRINGDNFRVSPGLGLRIHVPALGGGGAPLAFDFSVPVSRADTDDTKLLAFYIGLTK